MSASVTRITAAVFLVFFVLASISCHTDTEEAKVAKVVETIRKAAENKEVRQVLSNVSGDYRDSHGRDYEGIKQLLLFYFLRHQKVSVHLTDLEINASPPSAHARFQAILAARTGSSGAIMPDSLGAYRFDVELVRQSGEWKVRSANWERFGDHLPEHHVP